MADKSISELTAASAVGSSDLFVLEQTGVAKKLTGQILENWLVSFADGHGGIQSLVKTSSTGANPVVDTYTITYADTTTSTFTVTNGLKGDTGQAWYLWIKYAAQRPTADSQIYDQPDDWIGIYSGTSSTAPTSYQAYTWFNWKGAQGEQGEAIGSIVRISGDGSPGTTDVYQMRLEDGTVVGTFDVYQGMDGSGTVSSVDNVSVASGTTNVPLGAVRYSAAQSLTSTQQAQARGNIGAAAQPVVVDFNVSASTWSGSGPYSQTITLSGYTVTASTKVDIQASTTALNQLISDGVGAMFISNDDGVLTLIAIGGYNSADITLKATCYETN